MDPSGNRTFNPSMLKAMANQMGPDATEIKRQRLLSAEQSTNILKAVASQSSPEIGNRLEVEYEEMTKIKELEVTLNMYAMELNKARKEKQADIQEIEWLKRELAKAKKNPVIEEQKKQLKELTELNEKYEEYFKEKESRIRSLGEKLKVKEGSMDQLLVKLSKIEMENKQLKEEYRNTLEDKDTYEKLASQTVQEYNELEAKHEKLKTKIEKMKSQKFELDAAHAKIKEQGVLVNRNVDVLERLDKFMDNKREELVQLQEENDRLKAENSNLKVINDDLRKKLRFDYTYSRSVYQNVINVARTFCDSHPDLADLVPTVKRALGEEHESRHPYAAMERLVKAILEQYLKIHDQAVELNVRLEAMSAIDSARSTVKESLKSKKELLEDKPMNKSFPKFGGPIESFDAGYLGSKPTDELDTTSPLTPSPIKKVNKLYVSDSPDLV